MTNTLTPFQKFICRACGHVYDETFGDPDGNLPAGTRFEHILPDWQCPLCGVKKSDFEPYDDTQATPTAVSEREHGVVIIGAGLAGWAVVDALRALDKQIPITLITADTGDRYHKPMLSVAMSQNKTRKDLVRATGEQSASDNAITLLAHTHVRSIDPNAKVLLTTCGQLSYDKLVLAIGANPIYPPSIPKEMAWHVNHLDKFGDLQHRLATPKHVAIVGAGMVGVELAEDLINAGHTVSLIDMNPYPLSALLPSVAGERILSAIKDKGVNWLGHCIVKSVSKTDIGYQMTVLDQKNTMTTHDVDEIVVATGLSVDEQLLTQAGLVFHKNTGIVVDEKTLQTNVPDIYALGDCISIDGMPCRYVAPHRPQATAIAHQILGLDGTYTHKPPMIRLKNKCINVTANGSPVGVGEWRVIKDDDGEMSLEMLKDGEVVAKALIKR